MQIKIRFENYQLGVTCKSKSWNDIVKFLSIIKKFPNATYRTIDKTWEVPFTLGNLSNLLLSFLNWSIELDKTLQNILYWSEKKHDLRHYIKDKHKFLYEFQIQSVLNMYISRNFILGYSMGLGKTITSLVAALELAHEENLCVLIICPSSLKLQWQDEIKKFFANKYSTIIVEGSPKTRQAIYSKIYNKEYKIIIISYRTLLNDVAKIQIPKYGMITDEATAYKNNHAQTYKTIERLRKRAKFFFALTGTPIEKDLRDFHYIAKMVNPKYLSNRLFYDKFAIRDYIRTSNGYQNVVVGFRTEGYNEYVRDFYERKQKEEVLELPPKIYETRIIEPSTQQKRLIREIIECKHIQMFGKLQVLRQVCDSIELLNYSDSKIASYLNLQHLQEVENPKLDELAKLLGELNSEKMVIFTEFRHMVDKIAEFLAKKNLEVITIKGGEPDKNEKLNEFKKGSARFLVLTNVLKHGVNLDEADILVNFDLPYNPSDLMQREDRIHRATSTRKKVIITFCASEVEYRIYNLLRDKAKTFNEVVNEAQKIWQGLRM